MSDAATLPPLAPLLDGGAFRARASEVRLEGVGKRYGAVTAVKPLDLVIEAGTLVTLLGPSGCGKTTLLRMIAGLEQPSEGRLMIGGRDATTLAPGERDVSLVFQSYALFPHMSVSENVRYGLQSSGLSKREALPKAEAALAQVGLSGFGERLPSELSGGQQQRVALARALVLEPSVLLFDEPLSNLDARLRRRMREEIRELQQRLGVTVIYVTHDQSEALAVSDRIVVMRNAEIAQAGTPEDLYRRPETVFAATFMGEANHLKGEIVGHEGEFATVKLADVMLRLPHRGLPLGPVDIVIRPESVRTGAPDGLRGTVRRVTYMGANVEYTVGTAAGDVFALGFDPDRPPRVGDDVALSFVGGGIMLVRP